MDHENEIAVIESSKETALFLRQEMLSQIHKNPYDIYDLEPEYAKIAKNRSWFVILLIGGTVLVTVLVVWIASGIIEKQKREASVAIEAFEDLNLKNILDLVSRVEADYQNAINERAALESRRAVEINDLETAAEGERYKIRSLSLSSQETARRITTIDNDLERDIQEINRSYAGQIQELDAKITEYGKQLTSFDRDRVEQAQEMQKIADAEALRFRYEKEQLISQYENQLAAYRDMLAEGQRERLASQSVSLDEVVARYTAEIASLDPMLRDDAAAEIISQVETPDAPLPLARRTPEIFAPKDGEQPLFVKMNDDYGKMDGLTQLLLSIPWKNNTPNYIQGMNNLFFTSMREIGGEVSRLARRMEEQKAALNAQIEEGKAAFEAQKEEQTAAFETRIEEQRAAFEARIEEQKAVFEARIEEQKAAFEARIAALIGEMNNLRAENQALNRDLQFSNDLLARDRAYFGALSEKSGVAGYIIDPKHAGNILVYIDPLYGLSFKDQQAVVFRTGNEYIGIIRVSGDNRVFTASAVELSPGKRIEAGDRILLGARGGF
ncbi:MAG: hypothetical protein LBF60_01560 [Treponema sp.]|jgi:hypothetical protein|nr:hypothetical protein [Treponema sp.]